jgi:hypothetical protein
MGGKTPSIMHYMFCYSGTVNAFNPRVQSKKGVISYYNTNGIMTLKKCEDANHVMIAKIFENKVNNHVRDIKVLEECLVKRGPNVSSNAI